jgi:ABC-2 type transport system permease protein
MTHLASTAARIRRVIALIRKESLQIRRDPSSLIIVVFLPLLLLFIFGVGVSLDVQRLPVGVVIEHTTPDATSLLDAFRNSRYFEVTPARRRSEVQPELVTGRLKGIIVLRSDFSRQLGRGDPAPVQVIVDGTDPNTAGLVQGYAEGVWSNWLEQESIAKTNFIDRSHYQPLLATEPRYWFNQDLKGQNSIIPGAVAIILTLIGTLLTSLVVAREWERGTMEATLATPATKGELLMGKFLPYFALGMAATGVSMTGAVFIFGVPFRGSILALSALSAAYLTSMLSLGLLISTQTRNQFAASQAALVVGFLPAFELSGFLFEIDAMPAPLRLFTYAFPPRYFVSSLQTLFLVGDVPSQLLVHISVLSGFAIVLFAALVRVTRTRLE